MAGATGHPGRQAVIPARAGRLDPQPCAPEAYKARAVARGLGGLKGWRRVATRYDQHAQRYLGCLYLAGAWIWLKLNIHTANRIGIQIQPEHSLTLCLRTCSRVASRAAVPG